MSEMTLYICINLFSVALSAMSQIMLKKSAQKKYPSRLKEYVNPLVITAYMIFMVTLLISTYTLKVIPLSMAPILEASGYIFVAVLSYIFFKEKYTRKQTLGMIIIIGGIVIYTVQI